MIPIRTIAVATMLASVALAAAPAAAGVNARQHRQQDRIYQGVRSGSLNRRETYRLESQQARIARTEARDRRSGGGLSAAERGQLAYRQDRASAAIYRQKHDAQDVAR